MNRGEGGGKREQREIYNMINQRIEKVEEEGGINVKGNF